MTIGVLFAHRYFSSSFSLWNREIDMILEKGSKILVVHRRLYETDRLRYFFGVVEEYDNGMAKVRGITWLRDPQTTVFFAKKEERTKIISASSGTLIIYELPVNLNLEAVRSFSKEDGRFYFTDDKDFLMDVTDVEHLENISEIKTPTLEKEHQHHA